MAADREAGVVIAILSSWPEATPSAPGLAQLRLINAYRDGDLKAHRKLAEGTALVEVIQKAAEMVGHELPDRFRRMSSTTREGL